MKYINQSKIFSTIALAGLCFGCAITKDSSTSSANRSVRNLEDEGPPCPDTNDCGGGVVTNDVDLTWPTGSLAIRIVSFTTTNGIPIYEGGHFATNAEGRMYITAGGFVQFTNVAKPWKVKWGVINSTSGSNYTTRVKILFHEPWLFGYNWTSSGPDEYQEEHTLQGIQHYFQVKRN